MKLVSISEVTAGSVLAADLKSTSGSLILKHSTVLSAGMIARLKKMGIVTVLVEVADAQELLAERKALLAAIEQRFSGTEGNLYLQELRRLAVMHIGAN